MSDSTKHQTQPHKRRPCIYSRVGCRTGVAGRYNLHLPFFKVTFIVSFWSDWPLFLDDKIHRRYRASGLGDWTTGKSGRELILSDSEQWRILQTVSRQGYLDGITQSMETVDNLPWDEHKRTHQLMFDYADFQVWKN